MYNEGDIIRSADLVDPTSGRLSQLFRKVRRLVAGTTIPPEVLLKDHVIFATLMKVYELEMFNLFIS